MEDVWGEMVGGCSTVPELVTRHELDRRVEAAGYAAEWAVDEEGTGGPQGYSKVAFWFGGPWCSECR